MLTHLSLFSGIGGIDLAAEWAGFETVAFCEKDKYCQQVLEKHWPNVSIYDDIRTLSGESFRGVDLLTGGFPCQPFSFAGKRKGRTDDRFLWPEMLRVIREAGPTWLVAENVGGLVDMVEPLVQIVMDDKGHPLASPGDVLNTDGRGLLKEILEEIEAQGYEAQPIVIPAASVGARHRRARIFIVGRCMGDAGHAGAPRREAPQEGRQRESCDESRPPGSRTRYVADTDATDGERRNIGSRDEGRKDNGPLPQLCDRDQQWLHWQGDGPLEGIWDSEPNVGRMADGLPTTVDQLTVLGNAVVPQQIYPILKTIADIELERL